MPLIYLDNCAIQRPLDDRTQFRVRVEAEAVESIIREVERGTTELLSSDILLAESSAATDRTRRDFADEVISLSTASVQLTTEIEDRARPFLSAGIKALDALHLASAVAGKADYFSTTDDHFLKKAKLANTMGVSVVTPAELAIALGL